MFPLDMQPNPIKTWQKHHSVALSLWLISTALDQGISKIFILPGGIFSPVQGSHREYQKAID